MNENIDKKAIVNENNTDCQFIDKCPFFNAISNNTAENLLKTIYCKKTFEKCERFKQKIAGEDVNPRLWPNGKIV